MCLRRILFGYRVENDKYVIVPKEAQTVKRAFGLYINGMTLKSVADTFTSEGIPYSDDKFAWNKNMIFRILENSHYIGDDEYPQIVSREIFEAAMSRKNRLGGKREKDSAEIKYLKSVLCCSACGSRIRRISNYTRREKWICENNCKVKEFVRNITHIFQTIHIKHIANHIKTTLVSGPTNGRSTRPTLFPTAGILPRFPVSGT